MFNLNQLQRSPVRIAVTLLLLAQIAVIAYFSLSFENYVLVVITLLALPTAYCAFHYIRLSYRIGNHTLQTYQSIAKDQPEDPDKFTNEEVAKLTNSQEFQQYRRKVQKNGGRHENADQEQKDQDEQKTQKEKNREEQLLRVLEELEEKETQIFDE